jgi:hypothetical protein
VSCLSFLQCRINPHTLFINFFNSFAFFQQILLPNNQANCTLLLNPSLVGAKLGLSKFAYQEQQALPTVAAAVPEQCSLSCEILFPKPESYTVYIVYTLCLYDPFLSEKIL